MADKALHSNIAEDTSLAEDLAQGATSAKLNSPSGWPSPGANEHAYAWVSDGTGTPELIKYTSRSGDTISGLTRGVEGTNDQAWSAGDRVYHGPVAADASRGYEAYDRANQVNGLITSLVMSSIVDLRLEVAANTFSTNNQDLGFDGGAYDIFADSDGVLSRVNVYPETLGGGDPDGVVQLARIWDSIANATYDSVSQATASTNPEDVWFKPDGTMYFEITNGDDTVHSYDLSTAWDLSSASSSSSFTFGSGSPAGNSRGGGMSADGKILILASSGYNQLVEYELSTAWDVSTASHTGVTVNSPSNYVTGLDFADGGLKMYFSENNTDVIYEFDLETAYRVETATKVGSLAPGNEPYSVGFRPDGSKAYIFRPNNIYQWSCPEPFDLKNATDDAVSFGVGTEDSTTESVFFRPKGTNFYTIGDGGDSVYQYSLPDKGWESTGSFKSAPIDLVNESGHVHPPKNIVIGASAEVPSGDAIDYDVLDGAGNEVQDLPADEVSDVSSLTIPLLEFEPNFEGGGDSTPKLKAYGLYVEEGSGDATSAHLDAYFSAGQVASRSQATIETSATGGKVRLMGQPWQPTSSTLKDTFDPSGDLGDQYSNGWSFSGDGKYLWCVEYNEDKLYQWELDTPYELGSGLTLRGSADISTNTSTAYGVAVKNDGTKLIILDAGPDDVYEYDLTTANDISSLSYVASYAIAEGNSMQGLHVKADGTKMYVTDTTNDMVYQYTFGTAWDVTTITYDSVSFDISTNCPHARDVTFKPDGTQMFVTSNGNNGPHRYTLSTAWDLSTASHDFGIDLSSDLGNPYATFFKPDGEFMYVFAANEDKVFQYDITDTSSYQNSGWYETPQYDLGFTPASIQFDAKFTIPGAEEDLTAVIKDENGNSVSVANSDFNTKIGTSALTGTKITYRFEFSSSDGADTPVLNHFYTREIPA